MNIRAVLNNTPISVRDIYTRLCACVRTEVYERGRIPHATLLSAWITPISPLCPTSSIRPADVDKELTTLQDMLHEYGVRSKPDYY